MPNWPTIACAITTCERLAGQRGTWVALWGKGCAPSRVRGREAPAPAARKARRLPSSWEEGRQPLEDARHADVIPAASYLFLPYWASMAGISFWMSLMRRASLGWVLMNSGTCPPDPAAIFFQKPTATSGL